MKLHQMRDPILEFEKAPKAVKLEPGEQSEIAKKANVNKSTASRWTRQGASGSGDNARNPRAGNLVKLPGRIREKLLTAVAKREGK
jgi:transposase